jgi:hypothetical protein
MMMGTNAKRVLEAERGTGFEDDEVINPPRSTSAQVNFDDDSPRAVRMRSRI